MTSCGFQSLTKSTEFASGDISEKVVWDTGRYDTMSFHRFHRAEEKEFGESGEMASWGNWYLTTSHDENAGRVLL